MDKILLTMAEKRKTKRMSIGDMPQEFLNTGLEAINFDALINETLRVRMKEGACEDCLMYSMHHYPDGRQKLFKRI